ncbi:MAG: capsular polysaccharide synthesis protein [Clostridia bacterium]|nr:capsular polysaccharide synthesis protein [Clostridia bacterium]
MSHKEAILGFIGFFAVAFKGVPVFDNLYKKKNKIILERLKKEFDYVIDEFKEYSFDTEYDENAPVWVSWMQGYDKAPDIVKKCIDSIKASTKHPVYIVTSENLNEYADIPDYISEKYASGIITNAQFSDILRMSLLSKHGGIWIDATVFAPKKLPESIFEGEFYTCKRKQRECAYVSQYRWTSFINGGQKGCVVQQAMNRLFSEYWRKKDYLIDYLLVDYFMCLVYENIPKAKKLIDELDYNNSKVDDLQEIMNLKFDKNTYDDIISAQDTYFYKLSWRMDFAEKTSDGEQTFFGYFMNGKN